MKQLTEQITASVQATTGTLNDYGQRSAIGIGSMADCDDYISALVLMKRDASEESWQAFRARLVRACGRLGEIICRLVEIKSDAALMLKQ